MVLPYYAYYATTLSDASESSVRHSNVPEYDSTFLHIERNTEDPMAPQWHLHTWEWCNNLNNNYSPKCDRSGVTHSEDLFNIHPRKTIFAENDFNGEINSGAMEQIEPFPEQLCEIFEAEKEILLSEIKKAGGKFTHGGLKGTSGEQVAKNFIRRYTHSSYGFANGQIIDSSENISNEVDIAICNPSHPMTYSRGGQGILFIEAVDAVIEIKSTITNLEDLKDNCKSVRSCYADNRFGRRQRVASVPFERIDKTPYAVFAFSSNLSLQTIADRLNDWNEEDRYFIDLVYVIDEGIIIYNHTSRDTETDNLPVSEINQGEYGISPYKPDLPMFLLYLSDKMPNIDGGINPLPSYFNPGKY